MVEKRKRAIQSKPDEPDGDHETLYDRGVNAKLADGETLEQIAAEFTAYPPEPAKVQKELTKLLNDALGKARRRNAP